MNLGSRNYPQGDVRVLVINYCDWLRPGYVLTSVTAAIAPTTIHSTVGTITLDPTDKVAFIPLTFSALDPVNTSFTLSVQAKDNFSQTINDQLTLTVVAPGAT